MASASDNSSLFQTKTPISFGVTGTHYVLVCLFLKKINKNFQLYFNFGCEYTWTIS